MLNGDLLQINTDNNTARRFTDALFLVVAGLYIGILDIRRTTMKLDLPDRWQRYMAMAIAIAAIIRLATAFVRSKDNRKNWMIMIAAALSVDAVYFLIYHENHYKLVVFLALLTIGTIGLEYDKLLKVYAVAASLTIFPAIVQSWVGGTENLVYIRDMTIRSSWGIRYPTDMTALLFYLCIVVWVLARKKGDLWFLIPGGILFAVALVVADSRTSAMCAAAFMIIVCLNWLITNKNVRFLRWLTDFCACAAFPVFTVLMNGLVFAYKAGNPIAVRINGILSDRLALSADAFNKYGVTLFGTELPQVGNGGSTFMRADYNFVDISYNLILLQYGIIALIMVNILWVLMTRRAQKIGDRRLALALALTAFNCVTEHHFFSVNNNIFIAMPLAIIAAPAREKYTVEEKTGAKASTANAAFAGTDEGKHFAESPVTIPAKQSFRSVLAALGIMAAIAAVYAAGLFVMLPEARTAVSMISENSSVMERRLLYVISAIGVMLAAWAAVSIYRLCVSAINREPMGGKRRVRCIAGIVAFAVASAAFLVEAGVLNRRGADKYADTLAAEQEVIDIVNKNKTGRFYVNDLPSIYRKNGAKIDTSLFNGEELGRYINTSVIIDKYLDSPCFFNTGFLYAPVSDDHALLTNDRAVIEALQEAGHHMTGYYPVKTTVDMKEEAGRNGLELNEDGAIILHGSDEEALKKGPRADLRTGRYTITFDLTVDRASLKQKDIGDDGTCILQTTYNKGNDIAGQYTAAYDRFDKNGNAVIELITDLPDAEDVDFQIIPVGTNEVTVNGISWQKTPEKDTHSFYDENRVKYREEYFDLEGHPYEGNWGYFAKELEYDDHGNVNHEVYYDAYGEKTLNTSGYCEISRTFNDSNWNIRDEYYGADGKRIARYSGQSAAEYKYDAFGRLVETAYFDTEDKPVLVSGATWGGYHRIVYTLDPDGRVLQEEFFGMDNKSIMLKEGFASRKYEYDEQGNIIREEYFDRDGARTLNSTGYSEVRREFNSSNQVIRESYYGVDGGVVALPPGQAILEYSYDENGNPVKLAFYDSHNKPVTVGGETWGGYQKVTRSFDEQRRVIRESFLDVDNNLVTIREGYSYREYEYDDKGNRIRETYYDQNHKKVINTSGYAGMKRKFDEHNRVSREEYLDTEDRLVEVKGGYAAMEPVYGKDNSVVDYRYYDADGNEVKIN